MTRLIDVNRECDRLDDMYTLGEIGRRERDDMAVFMLEIAMPVEAIPIEWLRKHISTIEQQQLLEEWEEENGK